MADRVMNVLTAMGFTFAQDQKRQILLLDKEFAECKAQVHALTSERDALRAQVEPLKKEVERLKQDQQQPKSADAGVHNLDATEIAMMKFIGERRSIASADIQKGMELHSVATEHFLARLLKANFLEQHPGYGVSPTHYSLSDKGNAYLMDNRLVPMPDNKAAVPNNPKGHHCDHCGGNQLRRTGSRPDPTFGRLGIKKALYSCLSCGKESGFTDDKS